MTCAATIFAREKHPSKSARHAVILFKVSSPPAEPIETIE
jgi:hypothetical protein